MILETMYSIPALTFLAVVAAGWYIASVYRERERLAKLGGNAVLLPYKIPFGWDTLWNLLEAHLALSGVDCRHPNDLKTSTL